MILELDAGNTRIKWRLMSALDSGLLKESEGVVLANKKDSLVFKELGSQFSDLPFSEVKAVKVSSVRGEEFNINFSSWMKEGWLLQAQFAAVEESCGGVSNSYTKVESMGVDRWLAVLAAYKDAQGACCVVDCGSAITLDIVDAAGQHQGGYIVPGFHLMQEALTKKSAVLDSSSSRWNSPVPGVNTGEAVRNGILSMVLGLVERVNRQGESNNVSWYLSGGDAGLISPHITWEHKVMPDLVMDGLAIALG